MQTVDETVLINLTTVYSKKAGGLLIFSVVSLYEPAFFTGALYRQTTSDIEALHQAYHHIDQSLGDTDEQKLCDSAMAVSEWLVQGVSQKNDICAKTMSTTESGKYLKGMHTLIVQACKNE